MAGFTPKYQMAYFDFADKLSDSINVQKEIERFVFIDKQLYGLFLVLGNGVISGWGVYDNGYSQSTGISIGISSGNGIIQNISCESNYPKIIYNLSQNSTLYIYAGVSGDSFSHKDVFFTITTDTTHPNYVKLASVTTGSNGIVSIDNTFRDLLSFEQITQDAINAHKHRGSPTKIDLKTEVKNQLSGARLESADLSKFTNGKLGNSRLPTISHSDLKDIGILSHAQIDTMISSISNSSQNMATVTTINLLRTISAAKYQITDIDLESVNQAIIIAGISDTLIDYVNTTANYDLINHNFSGLETEDAISYVFINNIILTSPVKNIIITSSSVIPTGGSITFYISSTDPTSFDSSYTALTENTFFTTVQSNNALKIAAKIISPPILDAGVPVLNNFSFIFELTNGELIKVYS